MKMEVFWVVVQTQVHYSISQIKSFEDRTFAVAVRRFCNDTHSVAGYHKIIEQTFINMSINKLFTGSRTTTKTFKLTFFQEDFGSRPNKIWNDWHTNEFRFPFLVLLFLPFSFTQFLPYIYYQLLSLDELI